MHELRIRVTGVIVLLLGLLGMAQPAWAVFLDFNMDAFHPAGASLSYGGGAAPLVGTTLSVDSVLGSATPLNAGVARNVFNGSLDFTTGAHSGSGSDWSFSPGGSFTITGGVDLNGNLIEDGGDIPSGTTLLTGSFTGTTLILSFGTFDIAGGAFSDVKDENLAGFYGLNPYGFGFGWDGGFNLSFLSPNSPGSSFTITPPNIGSGDIVNSPLVPEPASLLLFSMGGLGAGFMHRRKRFGIVQKNKIV